MRVLIKNTQFLVEVTYKKRKSFSLRFSRKNHLKISAPLQATSEQIREVLYKKEHWLLQRNQECQDWDFLPEQRHYEDGEVLLYQGKRYLLKLKIAPNFRY